MPSEPRRLHPAGGLLHAGRAAREAAPAVLAAVAGLLGGRGLEAGPLGLLAVVLAVGSGVVGVLRWRATSYAVADGQLVLREGVVRRRTVAIPAGRVGALDVSQGVLQRVFGIVALRVQAAGGGREAEVVLPAVSPRAVAALREALGLRGPGAETAPARRLGGRRLALAALTAGQLAVIAPVVGAVSQRLDDVLGDRFEAWAEGLLPDGAGGALRLAVVVLVVAWVLSAAGAALALFGFEVVREPDRLRVRRGLLRRHEATIPLARIGAVQVVERPVRQALGFAALRVETAGYAGQPRTATTLFPLLRREEVDEWVAWAVPELAGGVEALEGAPPRARWRYAARPVAAAVTVTGVAVAVVGPVGALVAVLVPVAAALGLASFRDAGWAQDEGRLVGRSRRLARHTVIARVSAVQRRRVRTSPWQRRAGLASAGWALGSGARVQLRDLDVAAARRLLAGPAATV